MGARTAIKVRPSVVAVVLCFLAAWAVLMSFRLTTNATDVPRYFTYGEAFRHGKVPYRDFAVEYPPAAFVAFGLPALVASGYRAYRIAFELLMAACGAGLIVTSAVLLARVRSRVTAGSAFVAASLIALGPLILGHYDLWPALLVSLALAALFADRQTLSAALIGVAIAAKIYAFVLVPLIVVWVWRAHGRRRAMVWLATAAGAAIVCFLPFFVASPHGVVRSVTDQASRPLQLESSAAVALLAAHQLGLLDVGVDFSHSSVNLGGPSAHAAALATVVVEVALLVLLWWTFTRRTPTARELIRFATAAVLVFVVVGKVFSPQFLIWLVPLVPLLGGLTAVAGSAAVALAIVLTRAYFPGRWSDVIQQQGFPTWLLVARDLVLLALLALLVYVVIRRPAATSAVSSVSYLGPSASSHIAGTPRRR